MWLLRAAGWSDFWTWFGPGGKLHPQDFIENKGHLVLEGVLLVVIAYMFFQGSYKWSTKHNKAFTEEVGQEYLVDSPRLQVA